MQIGKIDRSDIKNIFKSRPVKAMCAKGSRNGMLLVNIDE